MVEEEEEEEEEVVWLFFADRLRGRGGTFDITRSLQERSHPSIFAGDIFSERASNSLYLFSITLEAPSLCLSYEVVEKGHR